MASLIVFPAIDLKGGEVVRLAEGDMDRATVYAQDPAAQAMKFADAGAQHVHVVDLDGAFAGQSVNGDAVRRILETFPGHVQLGGGIRTRESIDRWFDLGVARVVIGTAALENPDLVREAARDYPGGIVVAVDARDGLVATRGWADVSDVEVVDMARRFEDAGVASLLFTDVGRDGMLKGCNVEATVDLARATDIPVIASGGVRNIGDIHVLALHTRSGIEGVITGRAIYDGTLDLAAALSVAEAGGRMKKLAPILALLILAGCSNSQHKVVDACFPGLAQGHARGVLGLASGDHGHGASLFSPTCAGTALMVRFDGSDAKQFAGRNGMFRVDASVAAMDYARETVTLANGTQLVPAPDVSSDVMVNQIEPWESVR